MLFDETQLSALRERVKATLSDFRYSHTLGVESMAARLAELYCPEKASMLRAAALLHDVTKEKSLEAQLEIFDKYGEKPTDEQLAVPPTLHALTAPLIIPEEYPDFALEELLDSIRYHSTGREGMTLSEKIIFLADYIEETRRFEDCIALREEFFSAEPENMNMGDRMMHLNRVLLHGIENTLRELEKNGKTVESRTLKARKSLINEIEKGWK